MWQAGGILTSLLALALAMPAAAGDAEHLAARIDVRHTVLARNALARDPALAPLNLGVRVQNRTAVVWGPVPSFELMERAVTVLRQVPDLLEVHNEMQVEVPLPPPPLYLPDTSGPGAVRSAPARDLAKRKGDWRDAFGQSGAGLPLAAGRGSPALTPPGKRPDPRAAALTASPGTVGQAVARLQRADGRFHGIHFEVRGDEVHLSGTVSRWQDAYDLALGLAYVPGVSRVILEKIQAPSPGR